MSNRGRVLLCAALLLAATPTRGHAQVFLASRPHPDFVIGPLFLVASVQPDLGPVNVSLSFSLTTPPGQHPSEITFHAAGRITRGMMSKGIERSTPVSSPYTAKVMP